MAWIKVVWNNTGVSILYRPPNPGLLNSLHRLMPITAGTATTSTIIGFDLKISFGELN